MKTNKVPTAMRNAFEAALAAQPVRSRLTGQVHFALRSSMGYAQGYWKV